MITLPLTRSFVVAFALLAAGGGPDAVAAEYRPPRKNLGFPVYTNQPLGRQVSGQHAPATTPPLSPADAQAAFITPPGFEVRLFASEPEVVNPVAMTWDARGRLWVVELYEYPSGAPEGQTPRDRIKILEDVDADGRADKVHVWADGLNLATGILLGNGGAYVGQAPHLLFLEDTDGDDRADRSTVVQTGFGLEDRHELLNGFAWGPDGYLYMTHGVFTRSEVRDPGADAGEPVLLTAGVARFMPGKAGSFEVFAEGTSNPWGVDFDREGNAFVSACVIEHLFHMAPGGIYDRQAGTEPHPYAYERLRAINDHRHHMAAYAGIQVYQGDQFPEENLGTILQGNIHDNAVHQDRLSRNGSGFTASQWRDLVRTTDGWFMPVSTQVGPDGAIWIMDWYDRYPCYQNAMADPGGVDREHGRIWRVVYTGGEKGRAVPSRPSPDMNLEALGTSDLVKLLEHRNVWHRRMGRRLLTERGGTVAVPGLRALLADRGRPLETRLEALWTLHGLRALTPSQIAEAARDDQPAIRAWAARLIGERQVPGSTEFQILRDLAADPDPAVRLAVVTACRQFTSGRLTVNTPPRHDFGDVPEIVAAVLAASADDAGDPVLPFMIWHAVEPAIAADPAPALEWLERFGADSLPMAAGITSKLMRRLCDLGDTRWLDAALEFVGSVRSSSPDLAVAALEGLIKGQEGRVRAPASPARPLLARLQAPESDPRLRMLSWRLGTLWGDDDSRRAMLACAADAQAPVEERIRAVRSARQDRSDTTRNALLALVAGDAPDAVRTEAIAALGAIGGDGIAAVLLDSWRGFSAGVRGAAASALASRPAWALQLLERVRAGAISASDLGSPVIRSLMQHRDRAVREQAALAIGRFRESPEAKLRLVAEKRRVVLSGEPDLERGREVARQACLVCHTFLGEGANVGPDLTGVGRSSLDALLWNIIDPNQVIGAGYEQVEIETTDDRVIAGRLVEDNEQRVRLLLQGPKEEIIPKDHIASRRTLESSVMPEGLEQMPDSDFRSMVWYILAPPQEGGLTPERRAMLASGGAGE